MVRKETFKEVMDGTRAAVAQRDQIKNSKSGSTEKTEQKDELYPYKKGKLYGKSLYGAPYTNVLLDQSGTWKMPGSRMCQGNVMDLYIDFLMKIYKSFAKAIICLAGAVLSFVLLPGWLALAGIPFLAASGGYFMAWRNWKFFHGYSIQRFTVMRPMGNDRYYPRFKYKKGVVPIG